MMGVRAVQRTQQEVLDFLQGMKMRRTERLDYKRLDSGSFDNLRASSPGLPPSPTTHQIMLPCPSRLLHQSAGGPLN